MVLLAHKERVHFARHVFQPADFPEIAEVDINSLTIFKEGQGPIDIDMRLILNSYYSLH